MIEALAKQVRDFAEAGMTAKDIRKALSTPSNVYALNYAIASARHDGFLESTIGGKTELQVHVERKRANLLHLLDLKRAGHSPTRTELNISSNGTVGIVRPEAAFRSLTGSPSASCAEAIGR